MHKGMRQKALKPIGTFFVELGQSDLPGSSNSCYKSPLEHSDGLFKNIHSCLTPGCHYGVG